MPSAARQRYTGNSLRYSASVVVLSICGWDRWVALRDGLHDKGRHNDTLGMMSRVMIFSRTFDLNFSMPFPFLSYLPHQQVLELRAKTQLRIPLLVFRLVGNVVPQGSSPDLSPLTMGFAGILEFFCILAIRPVQVRDSLPPLRLCSSLLG